MVSITYYGLSAYRESNNLLDSLLSQDPARRIGTTAQAYADFGLFLSPFLIANMHPMPNNAWSTEMCSHARNWLLQISAASRLHCSQQQGALF